MLSPEQAQALMAQELARIQEAQSVWRTPDLIRRPGELLPMMWPVELTPCRAYHAAPSDAMAGSAYPPPPLDPAYLATRLSPSFSWPSWDRRAPGLAKLRLAVNMV